MFLRKLNSFLWSQELSIVIAVHSRFSTTAQWSGVTLRRRIAINCYICKNMLLSSCSTTSSPVLLTCWKKKELASCQRSYWFSQLVFKYKILNNLAPGYLAIVGFKLEQYERYTTRATSGKLGHSPATHNTEIFKKSLSLSGCNLQNTSSFSVTHSQSPTQFKVLCQKFLTDIESAPA